MQEEHTSAEVHPAADRPADEVPTYNWYVLSVLVLVYVLNFVDRQILSILANDIKADLGLTDADLGFLYGTAFAVFYALFGIPLGKLADTWHRVRLMTAGLSVWSLMTAVSGFAQNGTQITLARIGVGVGEATASPSAYSLISDYFPARLRATALAIYSSGIYIGGGVSLLIGGLIVDNWNAAYPGGGPLGLVGWQAAFIAVGVPGLLLALLVFTLREPQRGAIDGLPTPPHPNPFGAFGRELLAIIPPFTFFGAYKRGIGALALNIGVALFAYGAAVLLTQLLDSGEGRFIPYITDQWLFVAIGWYSVYCWASSLRRSDPPTFALIWGSPAFLSVVLGYGSVAFIAYAASFWAAPYAELEFGVSKSELGFWLGGGGAAGGFLGVILGGRVSDWLFTRNGAGRVFVILFGLLSPVPFIVVQFTTDNLTLFLFLNFLVGALAASALGAAAATSQALVLPRMRGVATATFFIGTTLIGLALGPYLAGYVSSSRGGDLSAGLLATLGIVPIGAIALFTAIKLVPDAADTLVERARRAGEDMAA